MAIELGKTNPLAVISRPRLERDRKRAWKAKPLITGGTAWEGTGIPATPFNDLPFNSPLARRRGG